MKEDTLQFNSQVKLVLTDVDETIADVYCPAAPEMVRELTKLLKEGIVLFFVTGGGLQRVKKDIIDLIEPNLRHRTLVSHCSGAEVWGFSDDGKLLQNPYYSKYNEELTDDEKNNFRKAVSQLITEFKLRTHPAMPKLDFIQKFGTHPLEVMCDDRGPQITLEFINGSDLQPDQVAELEVDVPQTHGQYDLRIPVLERAEQLFSKYRVPISPRLGGTMALDFAIQGVSKTTSVKFVLENTALLKELKIDTSIQNDDNSIEIWGDKFSIIRGGSDRHMSEAVKPQVRSIDFRNENPEEFPKGYNIVLWNGKKELHHGTLEYLLSRKRL